MLPQGLFISRFPTFCTVGTKTASVSLNDVILLKTSLKFQIVDILGQVFEKEPLVFYLFAEIVGSPPYIEFHWQADKMLR